MKLRFSIHYRTAWGESLHVVIGYGSRDGRLRWQNLQHRVRRLTRRSDIRDAVHESFLTRRQQHRRPLDLGRLLPKERKNGQNKTFLFIILIELNCFLGPFPSPI